MVPSIVSVGGFASLLRVDLEPMRRSSVLLLLSFRKLFCIQRVSEDRQDSMWERGGVVGGFGAEVNLGVVGVAVEVHGEMAE